MADKYNDFKKLGVKVYSVSTDTHTLLTKHGTTHPKTIKNILPYVG